MEQHSTLLLELFRDALGTVPFPEEHLPLLTEETVSSLYSLAKSHDLAHLGAEALGKLGLLTDSELSQKWLKQQLLAVYRYERLNAAYERICSLLEAEAIPYLPLKGAVIRPLYPAPYLRTSCDIDILVKEDTLEDAIAALSVLPLEKKIERAYHDVSLYLKGGIHLELHFTILEQSPKMDAVLARVWDYALPEAEGGFRMKMTDEFFLFHQIAHAAYHFKKGGCGIRPLIDVFLITTKRRHEEELLDALLKEAHLSAFYTHLCALSRVWLLGDKHTPVTEEMERYILRAGVYGSLENRLSTIATQGRARHLARRLFPSFHSLSLRYPRLEKHPVLYPFFVIKRLFGVFHSKKRKEAVYEIRQTAALTEEKRQATAVLFSSLGFNGKK